MPYTLPDGRTLPMDAPWSYEGIQYPANWLRLSTQLDRDRLGIVWEPDPEPYDQRFYWGPGLPKDHTQLVEQWVAQTRTTANTLLVPTDWIIIREADNGKAADPLLKTWREAIRTATGVKVTAITQTADTAELAAYITGADYPVWPSDSNTADAPGPAAGMEFVNDGTSADAGLS